MKHGQLFSIDALISLVLVVMVLGMLSSMSESLKGEIVSMIGWYERANIADNMLDILLRSPGDPPNWEKSPSSVRMIGLRSTFGQYIDSKKFSAFVDLLESNDTRIKGVLLNISMNHSFLLAFYLLTPAINVTLRFSPESGLNITGINVFYVGNTSAGLLLPTQRPIFAVEYSKGKFILNPGDVPGTLDTARQKAEWVSFSSRVMPIGVFEYKENITIRRDDASRIIAGTLTSSIPSHAFLNVTVPESEAGYAVMVIMDGDQIKALGIWKNASSKVRARLWRLLPNGSLESLNIPTYSFGAGGILIPWDQIITNPEPPRGEKSVEVWFYTKSFTWITVKDEADLQIILGPKFEPLSVKLWMWEDKR